MGIKDLWTILRPFGVRKPLYELQDKVVAIDLSCWVCEAQNVSELAIQPHMYLRNLYFRTCYLLLLGVTPVFVLEGNAPILKHKTIASRNALQFKGKKPKNANSRQCKDRSRFNFTLKVCEEMLKYMGLVCLKGKGEAEAMCAYLNKNGFVDGCITQDSDCFAYGAQIVYRNFSISQQGVYSASGGAIDEYDIQKLESNNGMGRFKIIALALFCGSDYCDGVFNVGKDSVLKLFDGIPDSDILDRLRSWRTNSKYYDQLESELAAQNICTTCGHIGKMSLHQKSGCRDCCSTEGCKTAQRSIQDQKVYIKNELNVRKKALQLPGFPDENLINEYLNNRESVRGLNVNWQQPDIVKFTQFTRRYLQWEEIYSFEKFLPVLARWHLKRYINVNNKKYNNTAGEVLKPDYIKKIRNPKGIPSYEIVWSDDGIHKDFIPSEQLEGVTSEKLLSTVEPQQLVETTYPELVDKYKMLKMKPKNVRKRQQIRQNNAPKITKNKITKIGNELKGFAVNNEEKFKNQATIGMCFSKAHAASNVCEKNTKEINLDASNFGDENDLDLSDIVNDILNYEKPKYIEENMQKIQSSVLETSFFAKFSSDADLFEQSFHRTECLSSDDDSSSS